MSYSETPCIYYKKAEKEYIVKSGDCLYVIFGHPATDVFENKYEMIYPNQKLKFPAIDSKSLIDVKELWSKVHSDTMFLVLRDKNLAYLVINGGEFLSDTVIWSSKISSGKYNKETPVGIFSIQRKSRWAHSISYDAPMYFGHQLFDENNTATAYWIHEGYVTGRPASHGCIRVPRAWAAELWQMTTLNLSVVIMESKNL